MLTESQKKYLMGKLEPIIREAIQEDGFLEALKEKHRKNSEKKKYDDSDEDRTSKHSDDDSSKRHAVIKWLDTAQELHSVLSYELWPDMDKDSARSEFSKKYNGSDADGKEYKFTDTEINTLYNMRSDFIDKAGLDKNNFRDA